jgi:serine/threonine protein kinase
MTTLGTYKIIRNLGSGTFGDVKLGRDKVDGHLAALKVIKGDVEKLDKSIY